MYNTSISPFQINVDRAARSRLYHVMEHFDRPHPSMDDDRPVRWSLNWSAVSHVLPIAPSNGSIETNEKIVGPFFFKSHTKNERKSDSLILAPPQSSNGVRQLYKKKQGDTIFSRWIAQWFDYHRRQSKRKGNKHKTEIPWFPDRMKKESSSSFCLEEEQCLTFPTQRHRDWSDT